jgi:hypothetical protein
MVISEDKVAMVPCLAGYKDHRFEKGKPTRSDQKRYCIRCHKRQSAVPVGWSLTAAFKWQWDRGQ